MASKRRKNNAKFKWTKELIILIVAIIAIVATTIVMSIPSEKEKYTKELNNAIYMANVNSSQGENPTNYSTLPTDNVFSEVNHKNLLKKINKEEYVYVLYGSLNNSIVLANLSVINSVCTEEEIKNVYIYSSLWVEETEDLETETFKEKQSAIEADLNSKKSKDVEEFTLLEYPALLVFKDGELIFNTQSYEDINDKVSWSVYIQKAFMLSKNNE